jgi:bacterioferritin-associated ferredoxin
LILERIGTPNLAEKDVAPHFFFMEQLSLCTGVVLQCAQWRCISKSIVQARLQKEAGDAKFDQKK